MYMYIMQGDLIVRIESVQITFGPECKVKKLSKWHSSPETYNDIHAHSHK